MRTGGGKITTEAHAGRWEGWEYQVSCCVTKLQHSSKLNNVSNAKPEPGESYLISRPAPVGLCFLH